MCPVQWSLPQGEEETAATMSPRSRATPASTRLKTLLELPGPSAPKPSPTPKPSARPRSQSPLPPHSPALGDWAGTAAGQCSKPGGGCCLDLGGKSGWLPLVPSGDGGVGSRGLAADVQVRNTSRGRKEEEEKRLGCQLRATRELG